MGRKYRKHNIFSEVLIFISILSHTSKLIDIRIQRVVIISTLIRDFCKLTYFFFLSHWCSSPLTRKYITIEPENPVSDAQWSIHFLIFQFLWIKFDINWTWRIFCGIHRTGISKKCTIFRFIKSWAFSKCYMTKKP